MSYPKISISAKLDLTKMGFEIKKDGAGNRFLIAPVDLIPIFEGKKIYLDVQITTWPEADQYGNDTSIIYRQSREQREAGESKVYIGNGKSFSGTRNDSSARVDDSETPDFLGT